MSWGFSQGDIKRKVVSVSGSGDNALSISASGKIIQVIDYMLIGGGSVNLTFKSGTGGSATSLSGAIPFSAGSVLTGVFTPTGHLQTVRGEDLNLSLSGAVAVTGYINYREL